MNVPLYFSKGAVHIDFPSSQGYPGSLAEVKVSDPGSRGNLDEINVHFFRRRVYIVLPFFAISVAETSCARLARQILFIFFIIFFFQKECLLSDIIGSLGLFIRCKNLFILFLF